MTDDKVIVGPNSHRTVTVTNSTSSPDCVRIVCGPHPLNLQPLAGTIDIAKMEEQLAAADRLADAIDAPASPDMGCEEWDTIMEALEDYRKARGG